MVKDVAELVAALKNKGLVIMSRVLIIAEHLNGQLNSATARCVSCAKALNAEASTCWCCPHAGQAVAEQAAKISGVSKVLTVPITPPTPMPSRRFWRRRSPKPPKDYSHVFGPSTTFGKDLMPCVAALLGVAQVSDVMSVESSHSFKRPIYAGNAIITVNAPADQTVVATVRTASWPAAR